MPAPTKPNRERQLAKLLEARFDAHELMAIARELDVALYNEFSGLNIGLSRLAAEFVRTAFKYGLIDDEFFAILHRERPRLRLRIGEVAALWHEERGRQPVRGLAPADPMDMVDIPAGSFIMGSLNQDDMADYREKPARVVLISAFRCMATPVTRTQWADIMGVPHDWYPSGPADDRPINKVTWYDAVRFCNVLSERARMAACYHIDGDKVEWLSNTGYRLPTEAEWEYVCRAGSKARYCFGGEPAALGNYAWFADNSEGAPHAVGQKRANAWGLCDMHGNVWEWCWDWYALYPNARHTGSVLDPRGPEELEKQGRRVLRGGSFLCDASTLRCAVRHKETPTGRFEGGGLRCVRGMGSQ